MRGRTKTHKYHKKKHSHRHTKKHIRKKKQKKLKSEKFKPEKFKPEKCSPKTPVDNLEFTCYSKSALHKLKEIWNVRHPDVIINTNEPKEIWRQLRHNMRKLCDKESCWLRHQCIKNDLPSDFFLHNFAPKQPKEWRRKPNAWLTSVEIEQIMKQYETKYKSFKFLGPSPIDYDTRKLHDECVWEEICKFSLLDYKSKGITTIGFIFNLDPHYKDGSHWVAMFINIKKKEIYYFDSYGDKIPRRLMKLVKEIKKQAQNLGEDYHFKQPTRRHQYLSTECGMYSLYFIIQLLKGQPITFFSKRITDKYMRKLRSIYFNKI